jgi:putative endonuclease
MQQQYSTYILTDWNKKVLYTGCTNNLAMRLIEHWIGKEGSFTTKYHVHFLVWCEHTRYVLNAIDREKAIKNTSRDNKIALITELNPSWTFLNEQILGNWPPSSAQIATVHERWRIEQEQQTHHRLSFHRKTRS